MKVLDTVALVIVVIGGVNWGLVGLFDYNLVDSLFGVGSTLSRVVYVLVGVAALYTLVAYVMKMSAGGAPAMRR